MPIRQPNRLHLFDGRKFGIEIEIANISQRTLSNALCQAGISCAAESYNHRTRNHWKATTDSSIQSDNGQACELVSPILTPTEETFEQIKTILRVIQEQGGIVNDSCGFHVHVDCRGIVDPDFWRLLLSFYSLNEEKIDSLVSETRRGNENRYCQTNKLADNDTWVRLWQTDLEMSSARLSTYLGGQDRYRKLNFASFVRHGTVEFRQFHGTLDYSEMKSWIGFCLNLVNSVSKTIHTPDIKKKLRVGHVEEPISIAPTKTFEASVIAYGQKLHGNYSSFLAPGRGARNFFLNSRYDTFSEVTSSISEVFLGIESKAPRFFKMKSYEKGLMQKLALMFVQNIGFAAAPYSNDVRQNMVNQSSAFRDADFYYQTDDEVLKANMQFAAYLFGYSGTEIEINRKVRAKIRNLGMNIDNNGHFRVSDYQESDEIVQVLRALTMSAGTSPSFNDFVAQNWQSNRYLRFLNRKRQSSMNSERYSTFRAVRPTTRVADLAYLDGSLIANRIANFVGHIRSFASKTARFWVSNVRNIERPYQYSNSLNGMILCFLTQTKQDIYSWQSDFEYSADSLDNLYRGIRYNENETNYLEEYTNFRYNEWGYSRSSVSLLNLEYTYQFNVIDYPTFNTLISDNQPSNFPTLSRVPYFEVVKEISETSEVVSSFDEVSTARKEYLAMLEKLRRDKEHERKTINDRMAARQRRRIISSVFEEIDSIPL